MESLALAAALLLGFGDTSAPGAERGRRAGDVYELRWQSDRVESSTDGSSGNSHSRSMLVERVIEVDETGIEVELDLPADATAEDRAREWQFPARILKPSQGPYRLLNTSELEVRLEAWLSAAEWPRAMCGRWIFTWNAFQIECDPQSAVETLTQLDLWPSDLRDGAVYEEDGALGPAVLKEQAASNGGERFIARAEVDPEAVRRARAHSDAVVLEISGDEPELRAVMQARSAVRITGTVAFTFEVDAGARVRRRTKVTELEIELANGARETQTITETVERRLVSRRAP